MCTDDCPPVHFQPETNRIRQRKPINACTEEENACVKTKGNIQRRDRAAPNTSKTPPKQKKHVCSYFRNGLAVFLCADVFFGVLAVIVCPSPLCPRVLAIHDRFDLITTRTQNPHHHLLTATRMRFATPARHLLVKAAASVSLACLAASAVPFTTAAAAAAGGNTCDAPGRHPSAFVTPPPAAAAAAAPSIARRGGAGVRHTHPNAPLIKPNSFPPWRVNPRS